jgi:predicted tellurium resistance membrane protein TerC
MYKETLECVWDITPKTSDCVTMFGVLGLIIYYLSLIQQLIKFWYLKTLSFKTLIFINISLIWVQDGLHYVKLIAIFCIKIWSMNILKCQKNIIHNKLSLY